MLDINLEEIGFGPETFRATQGYRDFAGTLNVNLKVLSHLLEKGLKSGSFLDRMETTVPMSDLSGLEAPVMDMVENIRRAVGREGFG